MKIIAHDEDSLTNLLFSEIHRLDKIKNFLNSIVWRDNESRNFEITNCILHQQVNFSEFGKPDAIIILDDEKKDKHIFVVEAKLNKYVEACGYNLSNGKYNNRNNSKLNNQITLRYRAMISLHTIEKVGFITEEKHLTESSYSEDQVRRCKKTSTCQLFRKIGKGSFHLYFIVLTPDIESPFIVVDESHDFFPLFFNQNSPSEEHIPILGSISWRACSELLKKEKSHFPESCNKMFMYSTQPEEVSEPINENDLFVRGRQIIEYNGKLCHLSCKKCSYAIRYFLNGKFIELDRGINDKNKYLSLKDKISIVEKAPARNLEELDFWSKYFETSR